MSRLQSELFPVDRPAPEAVIEAALAHKPRATFAMFSGGDGSLATTHWAMANVPNCEVAHINTGIGIERTREFVRETCLREGWPLTEIHAEHDCGQKYDDLVMRWGFPGPAGHRVMYNRLKERAVEKLVRDNKQKRSDKVMLITGICHDDSRRRSGYGGREVNFVGAQMWVNPMYWAGQSFLYHYINQTGVARNPVSYELGMSGECLCGAFASKGELAIVRRVCPATAGRIEALQDRVRDTHPWGWEDAPSSARADNDTPDLFSPMCVNCLKSERLAA